jgi:hypothetical protein
VRLFGFRQRLEPVGDLRKAFAARGLGHAGVHVRVLIGFAGHRRGQVLRRAADRLVRRRIADHLQVIQVPVGMPGFSFRRVAEQSGDIGVAFHVGVLGEVQVTAVRLRFTGKCILQVGVGLGALEIGHGLFLLRWRMVGSF